METPEKLDPQLTELLGALRQRVRRHVVVDSTLVLIGLILAAFWAGFLLDYLPVWFGGTEMPRLARGILALAVTAGAVLTILKMLVGRLRRPLPADSLALLVERHHPEIGGRLTTAVQLMRPGRKIDDHSSLLLAQVHQQVKRLVDQVDPQRIFRREPLIKKSLIAGPLLAATLAFIIISPEAFGLATRRLTLLSDAPWPRRADLEMVGVELPAVLASELDEDQFDLVKFENKKLRLPIGSSSKLRLRARAEGAELPNVCTVRYVTQSGTRGQSNMRRIGRLVDGYQYFVLDGPPLTDLAESITLNVRGLDDRLDDYQIEAVPPPSITNTSLSVRYPDYLKTSGPNQIDWNRTYQTGIRVEEGSDVEMTITSTVELGNVDLWMQNATSDGESQTMDLSDDGLKASIRISEISSPVTISLVPKDRTGISAQAPYRYFVGVIQDEPPQMELRLEGIGNAVTANAKIPMKTFVTDDYGVEKSVVNISTDTEISDQESESNGSDNPSGDDQATPTRKTNQQESIGANLKLPEREGESKLTADLRDLVASEALPELKPGDAISLIGESNDRYNLSGNHLTRTEVYRLPIVTPETLLALMERRELALRSRLEQTLDETRKLRDSLDQLARTGFSAAVDEVQNDNDAETRTLQVRRLRIQQSDLQANKTAEELLGIAASLDDMLFEMQNNRIDSVDRQERIGSGVRDPIIKAVSEPLARLQKQLAELEAEANQPNLAIQTAKESVASCDALLLQLTAILDKMLDLESYNEILDLVRELIGDQDKLMEDTQSERKKKVLDLFK